MADIRYFAGDKRLTRVRHDGSNSTRPSAFSGLPEGVEPEYIPGEGWVGGLVQADRAVRYKSNPSRHECDARCMNATGRTMNCECSCGGKNHGRGGLVCEAA
jgi:hypothetical protein